ncbi:MAG: hypothetical protein MZU84_01305 [Sphingobacterium sp.]|nr:hypothetical protein [Sphingobacterium sp.]
MPGHRPTREATRRRSRSWPATRGTRRPGSSGPNSSCSGGTRQDRGDPGSPASLGSWGFRSGGEDLLGFRLSRNREEGLRIGLRPSLRFRPPGGLRLLRPRAGSKGRDLRRIPAPDDPGGQARRRAPHVLHVPLLRLPAPGAAPGPSPGQGNRAFPGLQVPAGTGRTHRGRRGGLGLPGAEPLEPQARGGGPQVQAAVNDTPLPEGARRLDAAVYHAAPGMTGHLLSELGDWDRQDGDLVLRPGPVLPARWVRNLWRKPFLLEFSSLGEAAAKLRSIQRNWAPCPNRLYRRTALLAEKLPSLPAKPKAFPFDLPAAPMGAFTLLDEGLLLGSRDCSSPFPNGELQFEEDTEGPPAGPTESSGRPSCWRGRGRVRGIAAWTPARPPGAGPGLWRASAPRSWPSTGPPGTPDRRPAGVEYRKGNAFSLRPEDVGQVDWLFSDVICYPPVLYDWVEKWLTADAARNYVCTIKMQGEVYDRETTDRFAAIPGSRIVHLWHNKHELTWMKVDGGR